METKSFGCRSYCINCHTTTTQSQNEGKQMCKNCSNPSQLFTTIALCVVRTVCGKGAGLRVRHYNICCCVVESVIAIAEQLKRRFARRMQKLNSMHFTTLFAIRI